ncbi:hypothetical protein SAICODRAFT_66451 [Saitoella complicata NRRL Y-17804]|uniref:Phosphatase n=1 Tax=Saitoella complicata (strain BCRC 22490 / CBS 7301 / JCM 7358 / NBRC 10748 / NRRL Y-17804) TaxID=698492 RepID=A0A0E9NI65_SAICN|nr:uncharacterized protein SAICODRAFT_66451 [Saitoella complicata NRRL Y-17804]ODQ52123.1 hypothetical protein SAICODRAFT_66451 [Saitoella complicata NRRL Y-17804]GAO49503.1 hypothetical protein G7K_3652-t1 [Saitoella complicata NRRL Y-17804]
MVKSIVFSDFDGTITWDDSNDFMTDNYGFGVEKRKEMNERVLRDEITFRDSFKMMLDSVKLPFEEAKKILTENITLDPGFRPFYEWCLANDVEVIILSSGMEPLIRALLTRLLGEELGSKIEIVSNSVDIRPDGTWEIIYHDDSGFGHDKSLEIEKWNARVPEEERMFFYCGDGVSDLSAAEKTGLLFAKEGRDLIGYCDRQKIPYTVFKTFEDIHKKVEAIVTGKETMKSVSRV